MELDQKNYATQLYFVLHAYEERKHYKNESMCLFTV